MALKKILLAIDLTEPSNHILEFGRMIADASGASLHLLSAVGYPMTGPDAIEADVLHARCELEALLDKTDRDRRQATSSCEVGPPAHIIIKFATDHAIDLIVMGTHSHGPAYPLPLGSVADAVLRLAPCAVLAVKNGNAARVQPGIAAEAHA